MCNTTAAESQAWLPCESPETMRFHPRGSVAHLNSSVERSKAGLSAQNSVTIKNTGLNSMGPFICGHFFIVNIVLGFQVALVVKNLPANPGDKRHKFHLGRFPGG